MRKFKASYFMKGYFQKRLSTGTLNMYFLVVQWSTVRLMLIFLFIIGLNSQGIEFTDDFSWGNIPKGKQVLINFSRDLNRNREKCDLVIRLNKRINGLSEVACLWYEIL